MTYLEKATQLVEDSSVAVLVMCNPEYTEVEFLPMRPRQMTEQARAELRASCPGRGLWPVGVIGLVGATPRCALKEPLEPEQVSALAGAFITYVHVLLSAGLAEQLEGVETAELMRLWSLPDPRLEA